MPDEQLAGDETHREIAVGAKDGSRGVSDVGEVGEGSAAHARERGGEADGFDHVALEQSRSFSRRRRAARAIHDSMTASSRVQRCSYQPGETTPAP